MDESFEKMRSQIKEDTRNKIDQLFNAAENGDGQKYASILDEI